MNSSWIWVLVTYYFVHLAFSAGAAYVAVRLWRLRTNPMIWRLILYMHGLVIDGIAAIVLIFLARGMKWNWSFAIVFFSARFLEDVVRAPLILYLIVGPGDVEEIKVVSPVAPPLDSMGTEFQRIIQEALVPIAERLDKIEGKEIPPIADEKEKRES